MTQRQHGLDDHALRFFTIIIDAASHASGLFETNEHRNPHITGKPAHRTKIRAIVFSLPLHACHLPTGRLLTSSSAQCAFSAICAITRLVSYLFFADNKLGCNDHFFNIFEHGLTQVGI